MLVTSTSALNLSTIESRSKLIGRLIPLSIPHERVEGCEAGETSLAKVISHVDKYVLSTPTSDAVTKNLLKSLSCYLHLYHKEIFALIIGQTLLVIDLDNVFTYIFKMPFSCLGLEVKSETDCS